MFKIYTDSSANLPVELIKRYELEVVSFHYHMEGHEYAAYENSDADFDGGKFYQAMREGVNVQTSMINSEAFCQAFEKALSAGQDVLYIGMSSGISGAYHASVAAAQQLKQRYPDRKIAVIDTRAASLGEGLAVLLGAKLKKAGTDFDDIVAHVTQYAALVCQYFTVEDLTYLKRGGRISGAAAFVGNILQIKPILMGNEEGKIVVHHKERGRKKSIEALVQKYQELSSDMNAPIGVAHGDSEEDARRLVQRLRDVGHQGDVIFTCYEPVTGSHVGPGTLALFFHGVRR